MSRKSVQRVNDNANQTLSPVRLNSKGQQIIHYILTDHHSVLTLLSSLGFYIEKGQQYQIYKYSKKHPVIHLPQNSDFVHLQNKIAVITKPNKVTNQKQ